MAEYDNTNKGAAWPTDAYSGKADVDGVAYTALIVPRRNSTGNQPTHDVFMREMTADGEVVNVALFTKPGKDDKMRTSGRAIIGGVEYWVDLYNNEVKPGAKNPPITLKFKSVESKQQPTTRGQSTPPPLPKDQADIPF